VFTRSEVRKMSDSRRKDVVCVVGIVILAALFMGESLLPDKMLAPLDIILDLHPWWDATNQFQASSSPTAMDKIIQMQPFKTLVGQAWHNGVPLWEPHIFSGYPIIGNAQAGIFYPGTLPYIFLPGPDASDLVALFHLIVAGLGMFGYLRAIKCRHSAALFGAVVFMFNTVFIGWVMWDSVAGAWVWLPWTLWAFEVALRPRYAWIAALGAITVALSYLGGQIQFALYGVLAVALYSAFRLAVPGTVSRRRILWVSVTLGLGGTALAAIQLLPTLEYINYGNRGVLPFENMSRSLDWSGFLMLWVPRFYGNGFSPPAWWGPINYNESTIYVGIAPLLLALIAIVWRRDAKTVFFAGLGLLSAFCVAGADVYRLLYWLPGFNSLPPSRMRYLVVMSLAVLCALGLDWLMRQTAWHRIRRVVGIGIMGLALALLYAVARTAKLPTDPDQLNWLYQQELLFMVLLLSSIVLLMAGTAFRRWGLLALLGVGVLTVIALWLPDTAYQQPVSTQYYYPIPAAIQPILADTDRFRILSVRRPGGLWQLIPDLPSMFGLEDVGGYDSVVMRRYLTYMEQIDKAGSKYPQSIIKAPSQFDSPLVDLLNVKYAITPDKTNTTGWVLVYKKPESGFRLYLRENLLPRAWVASQAKVIQDDAAIFAQLTDPGFDPRQTVVLEQPPNEPLGQALPELAGTAEFNTYANTHMQLKVQMQRQGWLVLSEIFYPGWHATVDGVPANIYRANYLFRAIPLSPGWHQVELYFMPDSFVVGALIALAAAIILLVGSIGLWRWEKRRIHMDTKQEISS
jgi:hypothetical protein